MMDFYKSTPLVKLKSFKHDIAPIGFYFDLFPTYIFEVPILPLPMRIDKVSNGEPTLFIILDLKRLDALCETLNLIINFELFYSIGIKNLIEYAKSKKKEITLRDLEVKYLRNWWNKSININSYNSDLSDLFTFINEEFIKTYSYIIQRNLSPLQEDYRYPLIHYCETIINYIRNKIEENLFQIDLHGEIKVEKLYLERKNKFYPLIIKMPVHNKINDKDYEMGFVPYLIYEDLLDCFSYNLNLLKARDKNTINLKVYEDIQLINKRSNISDIEDFKLNNITVNIQDINLGKILQSIRT
ncbi:MAG: hypothetical protein ACFFBH_03745 [Promethearchaeota archaeon]